MIPIGIKNLTVNTIYIKELQVKLLGSRTYFLDSYDFITLSESRSLIDEINAGNVVLVRDNIQLSQADSLSYLFDPSDSSVLRYSSMNFVQDDTITTILFKDVTSGSVLNSEPINAIQAIAYGTKIRIHRLGGEEIFIDGLRLDSVYINGVLVTQVLATALIELNALFVNSGTVGVAPTITNTTPINLIQGNTLNLTMTGTNIVAYSWVGLPTGVVPVNGNERNIIGGSALALGTYPFTARATNYYGQTTKALELVVGSSFTNTYSAYGGLTATNKHFLVDSAIASQTASPLFRAANSTGNASDSTYAWSASWYQKSQATHSTWWGQGFGAQFGVGGTRQNRAWAGFDIYVYGDSTKTILQVNYGSKWSYLNFLYELTGTSLNDWKHIVLTYNGGDTDSSTNPSGTSGVEACFQVYINGANVPITSAGYGNTGFSGVVNANGFSGFQKDMDLRIMLAEYAPGIHHSQKLNIDEVGFYDYVLTPTQVSTIYNSGVAQSLHNIAGITNPLDYFRTGDGADPSNPSNTDINQFPVMYNFYTGRFNMEATNMVVADYVSDTPP